MFDSLQVMAGVASFIWGFAFGMLSMDLWNTKIQRRKEDAARQQKIWNDYLEALKGGQNGK